MLMASYKQIATILTLLIISASCRFQNSADDSVIPSPKANDFLPSIATTASLISTPTPAATSAPPASVTPYIDVTATATVVPADLSLHPDEILIYPSGTIYEGEAISLQVWAHVPSGLHPNQVDVQIEVDGQPIVENNLNYRFLGGDAHGSMAVFPNLIDKAQTGSYEIKITLDPQDLIQNGDENENNNSQSITVSALPRRQMPALDLNASWIMVENSCCRLHVASNGAAHRDLAALITKVDQAFSQANQQLDVGLPPQIDVYLVERVIGQGGYTSGNSMVVSYLDRQYSGDGFESLLLHEAVHVLDAQFAPNRIGFLAEGLAVWATGGHYKAESLPERNAALLRNEQYVPLASLVNGFIAAQHEIGYLEAGGFVTFLIEKYGWDAFKAFYADTNQGDAGTLAAALDLNLNRHFNVSLAEIEQEWLTELSQLPSDYDTEQDLLATIRFYETMRFYQKLYDPTAHFMYAWFPSAQDLEDRGDTATLGRHPNDEFNVVMEVMLQDADQALRRGDYALANIILSSVERALAHNGALLDPLSNNYFKIVHTLTMQGYEVHQVDLSGSQASVQVTRSTNPTLSTLQLILNEQSWILTQ